jgi:hypothetical protein
MSGAMQYLQPTVHCNPPDHKLFLVPVFDAQFDGEFSFGKPTWLLVRERVVSQVKFLEQLLSL